MRQNVSNTDELLNFTHLQTVQELRQALDTLCHLQHVFYQQTLYL